MFCFTYLIFLGGHGPGLAGAGYAALALAGAPPPQGPLLLYACYGSIYGDLAFIQLLGRPPKLQSPNPSSTCRPGPGVCRMVWLQVPWYSKAPHIPPQRLAKDT